MDKSKIYPEERFVKIMEIIKRSNSIEVEKLAQLFDVTGATIRADLRELERRNLITRTHGGAIFKNALNENSKTDKDPSYHNRILQNVSFKEAIGVAVAELIKDGDNIMLDDGSTTLQVAKKLPMDKSITVVTNGLNICLELSSRPNIEVIATGGMLNKVDLSFHGRVTEDVTRKFNSSKAILGASGISIKNGITAPDEMKAELKKVMIQNSNELIIVADHTKLSRVSLVPVCGLDKVSTLVTDSEAPEDLIDEFRRNGLKIIIA